MNDDTKGCIALGAVLGFVAGILLGGLADSVLTTKHMRSQAIEAGVARWVIDEKTGRTEFVYGVK